MYFIYGLGDPRHERIYYVGCTAYPYTRWQAHIKGYADCTADTINKELKEAGLQPVMVMLQTTDDRDTASNLERHWITSFSGLVNKQPGGLPESRTDLTRRLHTILSDENYPELTRKYAAELILELA
jgi:hypothetical protein